MGQKGKGDASVSSSGTVELHGAADGTRNALGRFTKEQSVWLLPSSDSIVPGNWRCFPVQHPGDRQLDSRGAALPSSGYRVRPSHSAPAAARKKPDMDSGGGIRQIVQVRSASSASFSRFLDGRQRPPGRSARV
jgi:hypothetical protein